MYEAHWNELFPMCMFTFTSPFAFFFLFFFVVNIACRLSDNIEGFCSTLTASMGCHWCAADMSCRAHTITCPTAAEHRRAMERIVGSGGIVWNLSFYVVLCAIVCLPEWVCPNVCECACVSMCMRVCACMRARVSERVCVNMNAYLCVMLCYWYISL